MEDKKKEIQSYIAGSVNVFVEPMVYAIVKKRPNDPVGFAIKWLTDYASKNKPAQPLSESEGEENENVAILEEKIKKNKAQGKKKSRMGISEEVFGSFNKKEEAILKDVPKSQETKLLILSLIRNSILFQNLDQSDEQSLIKAMEEKSYAEGETIIKEGQSGDILYIVESGSYDCFKNISNEEKLLKTYHHGEAFGELALMYNAPRAATIVTKTPGKLYLLDRITFSQVVKTASARKREIYKKAIDQIEIFADINSLEKEQFYDVLKEEKYEEGQYVIKQGEQGNKFYIVIEGKLAAEKKESTDEFPKIVYKYKEGDYFGELSLIHDVDRQASVKTLTSVRLAYICRDSFKRILGSLEDILKRNEERYRSVQNKLITV